MFPEQQKTISISGQTTKKVRRSLEDINVWVLIATIAAAIFIFTPYSPIPVTITKVFLLAAGALVTFVLYILARLSRGNIIIPPVILLGALWLPALAYTLSATFSKTSFVSAFWGLGLESDTLGFVTIATLLGTLAALVLRRSEHYRSFLSAGAWILGVVVALQALVILAGQFSSSISPAFSIMGSFNDLAFLLGLGIIGMLVTFRFLELTERTRRILIVTGTVSMLLLAVANVSLVWNLLAIVSLGFFVEAIMQRKTQGVDYDFENIAIVDEGPTPDDDGNRSIVFPLSVLAISLFFLVGGALGGALSNALNVNEINVRPSLQSTFSVANKVLSSSPIFGSGPGTFGVEWVKHRDMSLNSTVFWNIDFSSGIGFIPTSFVTTGLTGIIAWTVLLSMFLVFGLRMLILRAPEDTFIRYVAVLSFLASVYLFIVAIFDLPNAVVLALAFVFAGLFISTMRFAQNGRQWGVIFSRSPRLGFVIVFSLTILLLGSVASVYSFIVRYASAAELMSANVSFVAGNLDEAERSVQSSIYFTPSASTYQLQAGIASARLDQITSSTTITASVAQQAFQDALSTGINAALTATNMAPSNYQSWLVLGNLYAKAVPLGVSSAYESAKTAYEKAKELSPTNPQILYILAQLEIANKNNAAAEENLKAAISLKQDYTAAIFLLSQLEVQAGNVKEALNSALAAAYFTPNNPNILFQVGILYAAQNDLPNAAQALSAAISANAQFANARYFLSAVYAKQNDFKKALEQMEAIAAMSDENATAVASQLEALSKDKDPFPANILSVQAEPVAQK